MREHAVRLFVRFGIREQVLVTRRLAAYLAAGVPILEALSSLREDAQARGTRLVLESAVDGVSHGQPLSQAFRTFPRFVGTYAVSMIEVGERSGTLQQTLARLSLSLKKQQELRRKLLGALVYPAIIVLATLGISLFLIMFAFPKIVPLFRGFGTELPFSTRALIALSDLGARYGLLFLGLCAGLGILFLASLRRPSFRHYVDRSLLRLPVLGALHRSYQLASISRTMATLLRSGVTIVPALELASRTASNASYAAAILRAHRSVLEGRMLAESFRASPAHFPTMYLQMISTGERTGSLPAAFDALSEQFEEEFETASGTLASLIEPVLMVCMGALVGFIALAIITPVYEITQDLHG